MIITLNICSLSVKILHNLYYFKWILPNVIKLELIRIIQEHHIYSLGEKTDISLAQQCYASMCYRNNHITDMETTSNRLGTRLVTTMTMTIAPHHMAIISVAPPSHSLCSNNITTRLIEVIENPITVY